MKVSLILFVSCIAALLSTDVAANAYYSSNLYASSETKSANYGSSSSSNYDYNYNGRSGAYGTNLFAESSYTEYDGYQQAWRYLGWYVKCGAPSDRYDEGESSHSGSGDNQRYQGNNWCQRYLMWAAYVDENYQGGGIGEYQIYDPYSASWDASACEANGNGRCAPMDCHETNSSTWTLMGVFKEASYFGNDAFFEQLFKHEGVCVWNDDDLYDFMSEAREDRWTQGCVSTGIQGDSYYFDNNSNGNYIYLDLKPTWNGNMTYGLYTDSACKTEYEGLDVDVDTVSASMGLLYGSYLQQWNDGLEAFKVCQPCKAYNIANDYSTWSYSNKNNSYYYTPNNDDDSSHSAEDDDQYRSDPNQGFFQCDDDAGYTNVNQCMKFRSHAELEVATWEDLVTATNQGGILEVVVGGKTFGSARMSKEQYQYLMQTRREGIASEAKKYKKEAEEVAKMAPTAETWESRGYLLLGIGGALMLLALIRLLRHCYCCQRTDPKDFNEPLLTNVPPERIHEALMVQQQEQEDMRGYQ